MLSNTIDHQSAVVIADSQGKYFDQYLEDHKILTSFNSDDKIEDLHNYLDIIPSFRTVIIQIGSNNTPRDDISTILMKMQLLYREICGHNPIIQVNIVLFVNIFLQIYTYICKCSLWLSA